MTLTDARGLSTSASNAHSLDAYETALRRLQSYRGDPVEVLDAVLKVDPDFVLGHIFRAAVHTTLWEKSVLPEIEASLDHLDRLAGRANEREQSHIAALKAWVNGDWNGARAVYDRLLADHPRDALALQIGHLSDFYHGDKDNLRGRLARALPHWTAADPGYGFFLGMSAFGQEECGDYSRAEETGRHAIELEPDDCWAQHAIAHVMEMQARQAEGIAFMESRTDHWAQEDNGFQFHNWWHTALYNLDQDRISRVLEIYDNSIRPGDSEIQLEMLDAAALLWRLHLRGIDVGNRWENLTAAYEKTDEGGFYVFNDMHAMAAFAATGSGAAAAKLLSAVESQATASGTNGLMTGAVGLPIVRGIEAFGREAYGEAVTHLLPARYRAFIFGGSNAQRDIVHRTLMEAAQRDGQFALAEALANERTALKPHCPFSWQERELARAGRKTAAAA